MNTIKFSGAGWLFPFYFGVAQQLRRYIDFSQQHTPVKVGGVSAGSVVAIMLLLGVDFETLLKEILEHYPSMKYNPFLIKPVLQIILSKYVSDNVKPYNNKLVVGVCYFNWMKLIWKSDTVHKFPDRKTCIDALRASCHIPVISGFLPSYVNGVGYYDGELSEFNISEMGPSKNKVEIGLTMKPGTINPGIHLPELWKYYPLDPFVLTEIYRLGVLRTKEYYNDLTPMEEQELKKILEIIGFCIRSNIISYSNRVLFTIIPYVIPFFLGSALFAYKRYHNKHK